MTLADQGYSSDVLNSLGNARAPSTNQVYNSKWKLFASFCRDRGFPPETASPPMVADFLIYLFRDRKCSARTVASYRSALGNVLRFSSNYDPANDKILSQLIKGFKRQRPPTVRKVPSWDLGIVLRHFARKENKNSSLSLHLLTAKCVFLISLASAGRCQALAALDRNVSLVQDSPRVILIPYRVGFLPKQFFLTKNQKPVVPLRIQELPGEHSHGICPVRSILFYLNAVKSHRAVGQSSLFILHDLSKKTRLSPSAVGRYVVKAILHAYEAEGLHYPGSVRAHDVRGIATSLRALSGVSLGEVLDSAGWSTPSTFSRFYLKEFSHKQLCSLGKLTEFSAAGGSISTSALFL